MSWMRFTPLVAAALEVVERTMTQKGKPKQDQAIVLVEAAAIFQEGKLAKGALRDPLVVAALRDAIDALVRFENTTKRALRQHSHPPPESESFVSDRED